ncbi:MAG: type II toxin-antitoxin system VapC family toxin [Candidatus Asgardarchaeia archaeon]
MEIVVDASVVAKWYLIEDFREDALKLRDDYIRGHIKLIAPMILPFEVLNAIRFSKRNIDDEILINVGESLLYYDISLFSITKDFLHEIIKSCIANGITVYDADYVSLAKLRKSILFTANQKLIDRLNKEYKGYIMHIKEYPRFSKRNIKN